MIFTEVIVTEMRTFAVTSQFLPTEVMIRNIKTLHQNTYTHNWLTALSKFYFLSVQFCRSVMSDSW